MKETIVLGNIAPSDVSHAVNEDLDAVLKKKTLIKIQIRLMVMVRNNLFITVLASNHSISLLPIVLKVCYTESVLFDTECMLDRAEDIINDQTKMLLLMTQIVAHYMNIFQKGQYTS